jgi:hypothetical protein
VSWQRTQDEQEVLACLLWAPNLQTWELGGLTESLFADPTCRQIARALIAVRDSGRYVHWRRVRVLLRSQKREAAASLVEPLVRAIGTRVGLTAAISRLHRCASRRAA